MKTRMVSIPSRVFQCPSGGLVASRPGGRNQL